MQNKTDPINQLVKNNPFVSNSTNQVSNNPFTQTTQHYPQLSNTQNTYLASENRRMLKN